MLKIMGASAASTRHPRRAGGGWRRLSAFFALALLSACPIMIRAPTFAQDSESKRIETKFEQGDESYPAFILLDRVAIVLTEEALTDENYIKIVKQLGGKPIEGLSRKIIGIDVPNANTAADLKAFIRVVLEERAAGLLEFIADAGVLVTVAASESPRVMTDRILVRIDADRDPGFIEVILEEFNAELVRRNPFNRRSFVIRTPAENTLEVSNAINSRSGVSFAHPSFYIAGEFRASVIPDDEFFAYQWHLLNTGQGNGTEDADIDADLAWVLGAGSSDILIALIDSGFETDHPDLANAFWTNPDEIAGNKVDDDGDGYVDDVHGWDFSSCPGHHPNTDPAYCGDNDVNPTELPRNTHGTAVAGAALARAFNGIQANGRHEGVVGVCPNCQLVPVRFSIDQPDETHELPIQYAQSTGAKIINISWGYRLGEVVPISVSGALEDAAAAGVAIFVSMTNESDENCAVPPDVPDISANPKVIAVAGSTNEDLVSPGGFGKCLSVLAPTDGGTLRTTTTDLKKFYGYNFAQRKPEWNCSGPQNNRAYTYCFGGLSFSAPLAAGVAGLVLSHDDGLQWEDVKRLLQDTADKVSDSVAQYSVETGYSAPASGESPRHGYGRLNALEAVRVVADPFGGRGGVDLFVRDNRLDWGNTEQPSSVTFEKSRGFIPYWESVDIRVDAPPFRTSPPGNPDELSCLGSAALPVDTKGGGGSIQAPQTSMEFGCFAHEDPVPGVLNKIYVRAHNRGTSAATNVRVKLIWAVHTSANPPDLPADFWAAFASNADAGDTSIWHPLSTQTVASLPYSGASLAGTGDDASAVLAFDFTAPVFDQADHLTVLAIIDSPDDPVSPDTMASQAPSSITPHDNNVTQLTIPLGAADSAEPIAAVQAPPRGSHVGNAAYRRAWWYFSGSMAIGNQARATPYQEHPRR